MLYEKVLYHSSICIIFYLETYQRLVVCPFFSKLWEKCPIGEKLGPEFFRNAKRNINPIPMWEYKIETLVRNG